ncbi:ABC transporter ATP-binding protein [Alicyclobacillus sp. SO9]|nr:ABC transporter ATP-binding protein [Alicyclobacillus sp. SO9]
MVAEFVMVQFPHLLGNFTNALKAGQLDAHKVAMYSLWLLLIGIGYVVFYGIGQFRNGQIGRRFEYRMRQQLFSHWELLSANYYRQRSVGDLLNHALNDVRTIRDALTGGVNIFSNAVFLLAATLYMTFTTVSVKLTLVSMIPICFVPLFIVWWGPRIRNASRRVQEGLSDMADLTEESLSAIRLVKASSNEDMESLRFQTRVESIVKRQMTMFKQSALFQSMIPLMGSLSFAIALFYGGYLTVAHDITLGAFVAFTLYLAMIIQPLQQMGFVFNYFQRGSASVKRLSILLEEVPEIQDPVHPAPVEAIGGKLSVHLSEFSYPDGDHPALQNVHFDLGAGQTLGIVGRTASGKTTLANLIPRIFDPPENAVFVDGHDVKALSLKDLRESIAYVPQDGFLFSATVRENIGFSRETATSAEIEQVAKDSAIYDDILDFPDGFETMVGERGVTLSGGQKQRTAIARAFLKDAPILIMDDSLSAVDMTTEKRIIDAIRGVRSGKTNVIIAHRLSAVRHADLILVLDKGTVIERGTHDELLEQGGTYADIYSMQEDTGGAAG